nr:glycosyltransferase [uncultured Rhodoferax sp.]
MNRPTPSPKVSVIIPAFNRERYIGAAIQSVLDQTYQDFELIVVDDGSTDGTNEIIRKFDSIRLKLISQENRGRSNARNRALEIARGQYISFLDSDDLYLPDKLALQVAYMDAHPDSWMIYTSALCIDENGAMLGDAYEATVSGWIYREIAFFVPVTITLPTVMVRRDVFDRLGRFDETLDRFEDTDMWRRISKIYSINALAEQTCLLRTHTDNMLSAQDPHQISRALDLYVRKIQADDRDIGTIVRHKGIAKLYGYYGAAMMSNPSWRNIGYKLLFNEIRFWPFDLKVTFRTTIRFAVYYLRRLNSSQAVK